MTRFLTIPGFPAYEINKKGEIRHLVRVGGFKATSGYPAVTLYKDGKQSQRLIHDLLLSMFDRPSKPDEVCRHLDGNKENNSLSNLKWGTQKENIQDSIRYGTFVLGEKNGRAKLSESDVLAIREKYKHGVANGDLAAEYNVHKSTICNVTSGRQWQHLLDS